MGFDNRLVHTLVVKRMARTGAFDDYGQPVAVEVTVGTVAGLVQPRKVTEVLQANQAGVVIGEYVGYVRPMAGLGTDCWMELGGVRYDVLTMPDAAGLGHHLELGLRRID